MRLKNKVALISGGASGIGKATAQLFLSEGADVAIIGVNKQEVFETAESLTEERGRKVLPLVCDVLDETQIGNAVKETYEYYGKITTIINNAGIMKNAVIEDETVDNWNQHLDVNVRGMMLVCKQAFPYLKTNESSSIVNISSIMAYTSAPGSVSYSAAKSAIVGLTKAIAMDGAPHNIRANIVCPGTIDTPMYRRFIDKQENPKLAHEEFNQMFPLGRVGKPEDVAWLNVFLSSDESSYITGAEMVVDGGFLIKGTN